MCGVTSMHYLQTVVTTLQAVMPISQPGAFHCVKKNCARVARPSLHVLVMQYIQRCGGSGLVHETRGGWEHLGR